MRCSRIKQHNNRALVNKKRTRHHLSIVSNIFQCGVVHTTSFDRCSFLLVILCTGSWNWCERLIVKLLAWQTTITSQMPRKSTIETRIVSSVCNLLHWRPQPLLWRWEMWYPRLLLWRPSDPTALLRRTTWSPLTFCLY